MSKINVKTSVAVTPMIYAYTTPGVTYHEGWTKIGYTERDVDIRIKEQTQTANIVAKKEWQDIAIFSDGKTRFTDKEFHAYLVKNDIERKEPQPDSEGCPEWFKISGDNSYMLFSKFRRDLGVLQTNKMWLSMPLTTILPQMRMPNFCGTQNLVSAKHFPHTICAKS